MEVPKTEGKLKIDIRSDENVFGPGLFVLGFAPGSNAERQGMLRVGDELLAVNGRTIDGGSLEDLGRVLRRVDSPRALMVRLQLRRMSDARHSLDVSLSHSPSQSQLLSHSQSQVSYVSLPDFTQSQSATIPPGGKKTIHPTLCWKRRGRSMIISQTPGSQW